MKRILFIVTKSENGGAQKWIKEQTEILSGQYELFIASDEFGWLLKNTNISGSLCDTKIKNVFSFSYLMSLLSFVRKNKIDLIIASSANAGIYSRFCKLLTRVKVIYVGHGWSAIYNGGRFKTLYIYIENLLSKVTDSILCVSDSDYRQARDIIKIRNNKLKVIKNKIIAMNKCTHTNYSDSPMKILSVARFRKPKRNELLIDAIKGLDVELYLVGDGPLKEDLLANSPSNVYFLGEIDGFSDFQNYDVFALISDSEGLPLSAIEAMSAGLPLVLSNVGGCNELIDSNGVLVDNTVKSIRSGILNAQEYKILYSEKSLRLFETNFDLKRSKSEYFNYYKDVIEQ